MQVYSAFGSIVTVSFYRERSDLTNEKTEYLAGSFDLFAACVLTVKTDSYPKRRHK